MPLVKILMWLEICAYGLLGLWMSLAVWQSARGKARAYDSNRFIIASFSFLLVYRDLRIRLLDDNDDAKLVMCLVGLALCLFTAFAARAYGRGPRLS